MGLKLPHEFEEVLAMIAAHDYPDVTDGVPCCAGSALFGPQYCTCWERVHDLDQAAPDTTVEPDTAQRMCADCAFRPGSPERTCDENAVADASDLLRIVADPDQNFWCHAGLRSTVAERHPCGAQIPHVPVHGVVAYDPPIIDGVPYRADGSPAWRCAGLAAARRAKDWLP